MKTGEKYASKKHTPTQKLQTKGMLSKKHTPTQKLQTKGMLSKKGPQRCIEGRHPWVWHLVKTVK